MEQIALCCRTSMPAAAVFVLMSAFQVASLHAHEQRASSTPIMERVRLSKNGSGFVLTKSGTVFVPWGFNFVGKFGRIVEEYWEDDWSGIEEDFRRMRALGANVVRLHLQVATYMRSTVEVERGALFRLRRILEWAERCGLYLDLTGLGCCRLDSVLAWSHRHSTKEANRPPNLSELRRIRRWSPTAVSQ